MSKYDPSAHIPLTNMAAYLPSVPKAPLDPGTVEFVKGKPPIVQAARDWRYYETTITQMHAVEGAVLKEYKDGGSWREHYKTWQDACVPLGKSRRQIDALIKEENDIRREPPNESPAETLAKVNAIAPPVELPDPLAELEAQLAKPAVHAGPAPEQSSPAPKPKTVQAEVQPRVRNDNGKPIYAMPVWRELTEFIGKAINRNDAVNHLLPSPEDKRYIETALKNAFDRAEAWHEKARKK